MIRTALIFLLSLASGCAQTPRGDYLSGSPQSWELTTGNLAPQGLLSASARYDLGYGSVQRREDPLAPDWLGSIGLQRTSQGLSARSPWSEAPVALDWSFAQERALGPDGLFGSASQRATARWGESPWRVEIDPLDAAAAELAGEQALDLAGWTVDGRIAWQPSAARFASRAALSRRVWQTPFTASWQQTQPQLLTLGGAPGQLTTVAVDLSPRLRSLLGPGAGANLSYRLLQPDDAILADDHSVNMGLSFAWQ